MNSKEINRDFDLFANSEKKNKKIFNVDELPPPPIINKINNYNELNNIDKQFIENNIFDNFKNLIINKLENFDIDKINLNDSYDANIYSMWLNFKSKRTL
jgi:hypothetical protein